MAVNVEKLNSMTPPRGMGFHIAFEFPTRGEEAIANPVPGQDTHIPK